MQISVSLGGIVGIGARQTMGLVSPLSFLRDLSWGAAQKLLPSHSNDKLGI